MDEHEFQMNDEQVTEIKSSKGKKILGGCGCGCLVVILILAGLAYWAYRHFTAFVHDFEEQGYSLVEGQVIDSTQARTGSFVFFGQKATIGDVDGNVAAMCQQVMFEGTITGDVTLLCQQVWIEESAVILGNVHAEGVQQLYVHGEVRGEVTGFIQQTFNQK